MLKFIVNMLSWILGVCFNALIFIVLAYLVYTFAIRGFEFGDEFSERLVYEHEISYDFEFVLERDTSVAEVAEMLEELGVVPDARLFRFEMWLMGHRDDYTPGTFILNRNLSGSRVNARLRARPFEPVIENRITIREGWTQRDIAVYLEGRGFFSAEEFMYVANNHDFGFRFLEDLPDRPRRLGASRLEGYLFPDTYFVSEHPTPVEVITNMLVQFNQVFNFNYRLIAEDMGFTMDQIVTIASMIEREVRVPEERPKVARVIYNRLNINMPLQIDATVLYAMDTHLDRLLHEHLRYPSPFNTYYVSGLPLGPISNPGAASIHAALHPAPGNWLFYVLIDGETGAHYFTDNYARHRHMARTYMPRPWYGDDDD